jgi:hypothetical protein
VCGESRQFDLAWREEVAVGMKQTASCYWQALVVATLLISAARALQAQEYIEADAILVQDNAIILFTRAGCADFPPPGIAQLLVSTDGGRSWKKSGPALAGYEFTSIYQRDGKVWILGQHTAEGPATDPFLFLPTDSPARWKMKTIYWGNVELRRVALGEQSEFLAWIRHLELTDDGWAGPTYLHQSLDDGRTWKVLGRASKIQLKAKNPGFVDLAMLKSPTWRVLNHSLGHGFRVQHREKDDSAWRTIAQFPGHPCPE